MLARVAARRCRRRTSASRGAAGRPLRSRETAAEGRDVRRPAGRRPRPARRRGRPMDQWSARSARGSGGSCAAVNGRHARIASSHGVDIERASFRAPEPFGGLLEETACRYRGSSCRAPRAARSRRRLRGGPIARCSAGRVNRRLLDRRAELARKARQPHARCKETEHAGDVTRARHVTWRLRRTAAEASCWRRARSRR